MLVLAGLMLVAAAVVGVVGWQAHSTASDDRDAATRAVRTRHALLERQRRVEQATHSLDMLMDAAPAKLGALGTALDDTAHAENEFVDRVNHGADLHNQGDIAGSTSVYQGDAATALAAFSQQNDKLQQALQDARTALTQLQGAL